MFATCYDSHYCRTDRKDYACWNPKHARLETYTDNNDPRCSPILFVCLQFASEKGRARSSAREEDAVRGPSQLHSSIRPLSNVSKVHLKVGGKL